MAPGGLSVMETATYVLVHLEKGIRHAVRTHLMKKTPHCRHRGTGCATNCVLGGLRGLGLGIVIKVPLELLFRSLSLLNDKEFQILLLGKDLDCWPGKKRGREKEREEEGEGEREERKERRKGLRGQLVRLLLLLQSIHRGLWRQETWRQGWRRVVLGSLGRDTVQFCAFMCLWVGLYRGSLCTLRRVRSREEQQGVNSALAGFLSGFAMVVDRQKERKSELAVYLTARAIVACWPAHLVMPSWLEVAAFCLLAGVTQYSFVYEPDLMRRQYFRFIDELAKDPQGRLDKFLLHIRSLWRTKIPAGLEVMPRSSRNTDYYYTGKTLPEETPAYFNEEMQQLMQGAARQRKEKEEEEEKEGKEAERAEDVEVAG